MQITLPEVRQILEDISRKDKRRYQSLAGTTKEYCRVPYGVVRVSSKASPKVLMSYKTSSLDRFQAHIAMQGNYGELKDLREFERGNVSSELRFCLGERGLLVNGQIKKA